MGELTPLSEHALAVYEVLLATAHRDQDGRLVSTVPLYRFLEDRSVPPAASRGVRTNAVRELTERGLVHRHNVRGRVVELLPVGDTAPSPGGGGAGGGPLYEDYAAAISADPDITGDLDATVVGRRRVEQALLRRMLLAQRSSAPCAFCGRVLPADLLVAAHLQRRSGLTRTEKLDFRAIAVLACTLGCDALYEQGYLGVDDAGLVTVAGVPPGPLAEHLAYLDGRACTEFTPARARYFARHRTGRFRGSAAGTTAAGATTAAAHAADRSAPNAACGTTSPEDRQQLT